MTIIRTFDCNKPGAKIDELKGGVVGGTLLQGVLKVGDDIEIRPGKILQQNGEIICKPYFSKIRSLKSEKSNLLYIVPGGLVSIGLDLDPALTAGNALEGNVIGL